MISEAELTNRFGKPRDELMRIANDHTLEVQAWLASRSPRAATFSGKGVKASSTGFNLPFLNLALGCDFPAGTSMEEIEAEIEAVKDFFAKRGVPWYWWLSAQPSPANVGELLERHGMVCDRPPLPAMIAPVAQDADIFPSYPEDILVWRATSTTDLRSASTIRRLAFRFAPGEALTYFEDMASEWLDDSSPARLFLAGSDKSAPASIGAVICGAGYPGIYVMATLPDQHRRGYGKAIMWRIMEETKFFGGDVVVLTASKSGAALYSQFGFARLFDFDFYSLPKSLVG